MIRVMDEVFAIQGHGVVLFVQEAAQPPSDGCRLLDAKGNAHVVSRVGEQDGMTTLLIEGGDAAYFERLFRDVRVDATAFEQD